MSQAELNKSFSKEPGRVYKSVSKKSRAIKAIKTKKKSTLSLWDLAAKFRAQIPPEEWDKLPTDLARNVDHYLYGAKKID